MIALLTFALAACEWPKTCPGTLPRMKQTWQLNLSTIIMPCNNTGFTDPNTTLGWGIVDFDCACERSKLPRLACLCQVRVCVHMSLRVCVHESRR